MHPRTLARENCSGGSCPAVYDSDPDLQPGELAIVGSSIAPGLRARLAGRIGISEGLIVIKRALVEKALLHPAGEYVPRDTLAAQFETFRYSAFRLETLQHYQGLAKDDQWITLLRASRRWGKTHQRVHVVTEPLTASMEQELTEGYEGNVAAGEDIRILAVHDDGEWPGDIPEYDFWLFDSTRLYRMHYEPDGAWAGAERLADPGTVIAAGRARDAALHRAIPWHAYIGSRPDLQRRVAQ